MEQLTLKKCSSEDIDLLASMNLQLIEDEKSDNTMSLAQLKERMRGFLASVYDAYLFLCGADVVGYALLNRARTPLYLRQFFISRDFRRRGYGKQSFQILVESLGIDTLDLEVYVWNETGRAFWAALGFQERSVTMRYQSPSL